MNETAKEGYSMNAIERARIYLKQRGIGDPHFADLMKLTPRQARRIRKCSKRKER